MLPAEHDLRGRLRAALIGEEDAFLDLVSGALRLMPPSFAVFGQ